MDEVEAALVATAWDAVLHLGIDAAVLDDQSLVLFWRARPEMTEFFNEDSDGVTRVRTRLRFRWALPGVDLSAGRVANGESLGVGENGAVCSPAPV